MKKKTKADVDAATVIGTSENTTSSERLSLLKTRLNVAKAFSKKPHEAWKKYISEYNIDDIDDTAEIRDKVRIGYVFRKIETELPAIFDDQPELFLRGRHSDLKDIEPLFESLYDLLWDIQSLEEKVEDVGLYFELLGMGFMESPYVVKTKKVKEMQPQPVMDELGQPMMDEMGQPVTQEVEVEYEVPIIDNPVAGAIDPFKIHFSPETKFNLILDYEHCPYYFKEKVMTKEEIKAKWDKEVEPSERLNTNDTELNTEIDKEVELVNKDDLKRVTVYEYYGILPEKMAEGVKGDGWAYDKDYHVYMTKNEELFIEESPYEIKPCFVLGNYGLANKFWKFGDAKHLMPLVQELEQYRSQILKHTRKMANPKPLIENNSEVDEQAFNDSRVGKPVKFTGTAPSYLSPSNLGSEVATGVEMVRTDLEKTAPGFDLSGGGSSSQVKSPRGIAVYSEAADRGVRRKRKKVARFIRQIVIFQFRQIGQNWKPEDYKKIDIDGKQEEITPEVLMVLNDPNILNRLDIEIESLSVNQVQQKQESLELFDLAVANPDIFNKMEMAKDLLQNGFRKKDADRYLVPEVEVAKKYIMQFLSQVAGQNPDLAMGLAPAVEQFQLVDETGQPQNQGEVAQPEPQGDLPPLPEV